MSNENAIVVFDVEKSITNVEASLTLMRRMRTGGILVKGKDYDSVGGSKPTLLKPGAEKLCSTFGLAPRFADTSRTERFDPDSPLFHYEFECILTHIETGKEVARASGSCNSMESKYRWRNVQEHEVLPSLDKSTLKKESATIGEFSFAVKKRETSGKYGKPEEYWTKFEDAIAGGQAVSKKRKTKSGESDYWEITSHTYRVPNDDIYSQVNTILKMAQKRALVAAVLIATNASEQFTQDVEDLPDFSSNVVDVEYEEVPRRERQPQQPQITVAVIESFFQAFRDKIEGAVDMTDSAIFDLICEENDVSQYDARWWNTRFNGDINKAKYELADAWKIHQQLKPKSALDGLDPDFDAQQPTLLDNAKEGKPPSHYDDTDIPM